MRKFSTMLVAFSCSLFVTNSTVNAQGVTIKKTVSYSKGGTSNDSRIAVLLSNNTVWYAAPEKTWEAVPMDGLPAGMEYIDFEMFQKVSMGITWSYETRLLLLAKDNTLWWYANKKSWEAVPLAGLPKGKAIKDISAFNKGTMTALAQSTRIVALLEDNTLWWFGDGNWEKVSLEGLPK